MSSWPAPGPTTFTSPLMCTSSLARLIVPSAGRLNRIVSTTGLAAPEAQPLFGTGTFVFAAWIASRSVQSLVDVELSAVVLTVIVAARAEAAQTLRTIRPAASTARVSLKLVRVQAGAGTAPSVG